MRSTVNNLIYLSIFFFRSELFLSIERSTSFSFPFLFFQDGASYGSTRIARGPIMEIDNVRKEDSGTYICTASNNVGTISADQIELKVLCKFFSHLFYHALCCKIIFYKIFTNFFTCFTYDKQTQVNFSSQQKKSLLLWITHPTR